MWRGKSDACEPAWIIGQRIACLTYHKFPEAAWPADEFRSHTVKLVSGQVVPMLLSERGTRLSNGLWVREIRKLTDRGHQTAILSTDYESEMPRLAVAMFARWSQENFFKYARKHFGLDRLVDYSTHEITDPIEVVNPAYRQLDGQVRSANGKLSRLMAKFGALNCDEPIEPEKMEPFIQKKAALQENIEERQAEISALKATRKQTPRHIKVQDLPDDARFRQLSTRAKQFIDTIKMLAYRAETAMANSLREFLSHPNEARVLLQALYSTEADLLPDYQQQTLTVRLHHSARSSTDTALRSLCDELNATETRFPNTNLRLIFNLGANQNPRDQEV
jgi:hypothetical protein